MIGSGAGLYKPAGNARLGGMEMQGCGRRVAVALVHHPVLNRKGEAATTAVTPMDVHDFARTCAFYDVAPVYFVHPAPAMRAMVDEIAGYWREGEGGRRNPGRKAVLERIRLRASLEDVLAEADWRLWYTSASPPEREAVVAPAELRRQPGPHLIVFGTGWGLDAARLPPPNGWLSPIAGIGMVRHLSVRAALAIYLDRLTREAI